VETYLIDDASAIDLEIFTKLCLDREFEENNQDLLGAV